MIRSSCRSFAQSVRIAPAYLSRTSHSYTSQPAASLRTAFEQPATREEEFAGVDWDNLGFSLIPTDYMFVMRCSQHDGFQRGQLSRFGNIELSPAAGVLNYGQGIFEGTKAYRREDGGLLLFRPEENATRMKGGAERMCMPCPSVEQFVDAVAQTAIANKRWIPPSGKGALYMRPLLLGTGAMLGVAPAPDYTFLVYASPVGKYFKDANASLNLRVEEEYVRAAPGGAGGVKTISNYAPVLKALIEAKGEGFSDVLYLDPIHKKYLEESSASNIFVLKGNIMSTPATSGTILPGVTRKTIIDIASDLGYQVEEKSVSVDELIEADEVFCTGTAVGVAPVGGVTYRGRRFQFKVDTHSTCRKLHSTLAGIQTGLLPDKRGWTVEIE